MQGLVPYLDHGWDREERLLRYLQEATRQGQSIRVSLVGDDANTLTAASVMGPGQRAPSARRVEDPAMDTNDIRYS